MIKGPHAPQWTTLGSGPQGRFSNPSESGPGYPQPGEAHRARAEVARTGLQYRWASCASIESVPHVSSSSGSQAVSAQALSATSESAQGQYPVAHRPSVPHAGVVSCPASRALFDAGGQVRGCSDRPPSRSGPVHSDIRVPSDSPFQLDVTPLAVAGSLPATDRSVQEAPPHLMMPVTTPAGPRMKQKSAHETSR